MVQAQSLPAALSHTGLQGEADQLAEQLTGQLAGLQQQLTDATDRATSAEAKVKNLQAALEEAETQASVSEDQVQHYKTPSINGSCHS